jgi:hypothetical protein
MKLTIINFSIIDHFIIILTEWLIAHLAVIDIQNM